MSRASPDAAPSPGSEDPVFYPVKWVLNPAGKSVPICMQARNGPCALLALVNVNLQKQTFTLEPGTTRMREDHLMAILADFVSTQTPTGGGEDAAVLREHAIADFIDLLPRLNRGMDVNVRFDTPTSFEFTRELSVFDIFPGVRLMHGWLVDPQDTRLAEALGRLTYNQVIDELVRTACSPPAPPPEPEEGAAEEEADALAHIPSAPPLEAFGAAVAPDLHDIPNAPPSSSFASEVPEESEHTNAIREIRPFVMDFLESNRTQLTVYGLTELHTTMREDETSILFRNSHFYVILKQKGELYTLVTDVGYLNELNTVWEKLSDVNGDSTFYNGSFERIGGSGMVNQLTKAAPQVAQPASTRGPPQQVPPRSASGRPASSPVQLSAWERQDAPPASSRASGRAGAGSSRAKNSDKCSVQ